MSIQHINRAEGTSGPRHRGRMDVEGLLLAGILGGGVAALAGGLAVRCDGLALALGALLALARLVSRERRGRHLAEAAHEQLQRDKYEFVATVSHELRTPLTAVVGFSQLLSDESRPIDLERRRDYLRILCEQSRHLARIIEDAVDLSRIDEGRLSTRPVVLGIHHALEGALALLEAASERDRLDISIAPETPYVWADQAEIEQVFDRLLHVALTRSARGSRVLVKAGPGRDGGSRVTVSATGLDLHADAFAPLRDDARASSLWRDGERYMGMAAARAILELHGGKVWTEQEGEQAAICFWLPAAEAQVIATPSLTDQTPLPAGAHETA